MTRAGYSLALGLLFIGFLGGGPVGAAQPSFIAFESGQVRPLALSPDGSRLFAVNTPDNRLEVFAVSGAGLTHIDSIPVGMEPVAVAPRNNNEVWVVNHLSDSVSVVDLTASPAKVVRTLLVGDEPRDIVFAGTGGTRAFISTAHRGQHRTHGSIGGVPGAGDPQLTTEGIGRADVWVFDATSLGSTIGGNPVEIVTFFADTPRALAVSPDGNTVYLAAFHSGNETTAINETVVCNGFQVAGGSGCGAGAPGGVPGPSTNADTAGAPETGLIVKFDGTNWKDAIGRNWDSLVKLSLPDHDVFALNANTLAPGAEFDHVGTILFNMAVNPSSGKVFVTNTELPNHVRFEGPGNFGGSTVQGHLSESRITVIDPVGPVVSPKHLNQHIDYGKLHTDVPDLVDTSQVNHSLATPVQPVFSSDGSTLYVAAFGSGKVGVFATSDIDDPNFAVNFDPTTESANYITVPGGGPSGLALDETNDRLYVMQRFDNSVAVVNLTTKATLATHALYDREPPSVSDGRPMLYDALGFSGNGEASCSSCHIFGDFDSLAWNLGDPDASVSTNTQPSSSVLPPAGSFHPMKGPMTTQTLRGMATHGALHWRGDRVDGFFGLDPCTEPTGAPCDEDFSFRNFIVAFEGLIGMDGTPTPSEMQAFSDFILQVMLPPNPVRALENTLTASQLAGSNLFFGAVTDTVENCDGCHDTIPAQGFFGTRGQQSFEGEPQNAKVAHMRNLYAKIGMFGLSTGGPNLGDQVRGFGFLHDGSVDTVKHFLEAGVFSLNNTQELNLEQFSLAFPTDLAPIVGQQVTLTSSNGGVVNPRIDLMNTRAATSYPSLMLGAGAKECDVVVKGSVGGTERGWVRLASGDYEDDLGNVLTDGALRALASSEGPLTYTCAPPGSGRRMGVDRDFDALSDGVETDTGIFVGPGDTGTSPTNSDTDGDGFTDGAEVAAGSNPLNPLSTPGIPVLPVWALVTLGSGVLGSGLLAVRRRRPRG